MSTGLLVRQHQLDLAQCRQLCLKPLFDIERLLQFGGHIGASWEPTSVPLSSAINLLIRSQAMDGGFEPAVISRWLPLLRNETLLTLGEDIYAWSCLRPFEAWSQFLPKLYGQGKDVRPHIAGLLNCSLADTVATVRLYSASDVQAFGRFEHTAPRSGPAPRITIRADDLADRVRQVCGTVLFTVHPRDRAAA